MIPKLDESCVLASITKVAPNVLENKNIPDGAQGREATFVRVPPQCPETGAVSAMAGVNRSNMSVSDSLLNQFSRTGAWVQMSQSERQAFVGVAETCLTGLKQSADGAATTASSAADIQRVEKAFVELLQRQVNNEQGVREFVILQRDKDVAAGNRTTLDHLATIAASNLKPQVQEVKDSYLAGIVAEIAAPRRENNQGRDTTCIPTTHQGQLEQKVGAEYARVCQELATRGYGRGWVEDPTSGERRLADQAKGERVLELVDHVPSKAELCGRSYSEYFYQRSCMKAFNAVDGGLYSGAAEELFEYLTGKPFRRIDPENAKEARAELARVTTDADGVGFNMAALKWGKAGDLHQNHIVEIISADSKYVTFRNPWGKEFQKIPDGVPAQLVDGEESTYRLKVKDFDRLLNYCLVSENESKGRLAFGLTAGYDESQIGFDRYAYAKVHPVAVIFEPEAMLALALASQSQFQKDMKAQEDARKKHEKEAAELANRVIVAFRPDDASKAA